MVEAARARGLDARIIDGQALTVRQAFEAVFSNAALHWMLQSDAVLRGVAQALRPVGRFFGEFGGHGNVAAITVALMTVLARRGIDGRAALPWYFPTPDGYAAKLQAHGFVVDRIELIPRPTPLPTGMAGWLDTFAEPFFSRLGSARASACRRAPRWSSCLLPACATRRVIGPQTMSACALRSTLAPDSDG